MKANEFIKEHGLEKVRSIINKYSNYTHSTDDARMFVNEHDCIEHIKKDLHTCVRFDDLKRLIESHDLVEKLRGLEKSKAISARSPSNAESYQDGYYFRTKPEFLFHNGFHHWNMTTNDGKWFKDLGFKPVLIADLKQAIADVESCQ